MSFAAAAALLVSIIYLIGFINDGSVNKTGGCLMVILALAVLIGGGILTLLMAISWM